MADEERGEQVRANLLLEPFEMAHIAARIKLPQSSIQFKLSQMYVYT